MRTPRPRVATRGYLLPDLLPRLLSGVHPELSGAIRICVV